MGDVIDEKEEQKESSNTMSHCGVGPIIVDKVFAQFINCSLLILDK